jgi:hypothetical protein
MLLVARDEIPRLRDLRDSLDEAEKAAAEIVDPPKEALLRGIEEAFAAGEPDSRIARSVDWSREYVGRLRKKWVAKQKQTIKTDGGADHVRLRPGP